MSAERALHNIDFANASHCLDTLRSLNPTDFDDTLTTMSYILEGMCVRPPEAQNHLQVLEEIRPTLDFVINQASQRYISRPLPPVSEEQERLTRVTRGWQIMADNYALIAQRASIDHSLQDKLPLLAHRRLQYNALAMIEYFKARREMPAGFWQAIHYQYAQIEKAQLHNTRVADPLNDVWGAQSAHECYVSLLLVDAAMPCSRTPRELNWILRWAQRFAPYCQIQAAGSPMPAKQTTFALNPAADYGLRPQGVIGEQTEPLRSVDTHKLASHIQAVVGQLKKGATPASLGLGEDCIQPACSRLLVALYRPWGHATAGRKHPRKRVQNGHVTLCVEPQAIAFFLEGKEFTQPSNSRATSFSETQVFRDFGEDIEPADNLLTAEHLRLRAEQLGYMPEEPWQVIDQSLTGYRLSRTRGHSRVEHRQLIGLRSDPNAGLLLAEVNWLQYQNNGHLQAGVNVMPGPAHAVALRLHIGDRSTRERYRLGFMVPGVPSLDEGPSLVVPAGWYLNGRRVEMYDRGSTFIRMEKLLSRGANFDRIAFSREPSEDHLD